MTTPTHQSMTTLKSANISHLLTQEVSSMEQLLNNALKIEQILIQEGIIHQLPTNTTTAGNHLLTMMISGISQIVADNAHKDGNNANNTPNGELSEAESMYLPGPDISINDNAMVITKNRSLSL